MNRNELRNLFLFIWLLLISTQLLGNNNLLYWEAQGVISYTTHTDEFVYYSHHSHGVMQKPSLGIDYVHRFRSTGGDRGYLSLQARLAYDKEMGNRIEPQLYNAFINLKISRSDLWVGHNKTALGLSSYLDNHALLMGDNSMSRLNYDRDWGLGYYIQKQKTDYRISLTTGSGMPLYFADNYFLAARIGFGDLERDNRTIGLSLAQGNTIYTMGYHYMHDKKSHAVYLGGLDLSLRYLNRYLMTDVIAGEYDDKTAYAALVRAGLNLLEDDILNLEAQMQLQRIGDNNGQIYAAGLAYRLSPYLTIRTHFSLEEPGGGERITLQLYYYRGMIF